VPVTSWRKRVIRPKDLLVLEFEFINLELLEVGCLRPLGEGAHYIILHFPPQNIGEEAFFEKAEGYTIPPNPINGEGDPDNELTREDSEKLLKTQPLSRITGPSRLVFEVPAGQTIRYTLPDLLDWCTRLPLRIVPHGMEADTDMYIGRVSVVGSLVKQIPLLREAARRRLIVVLDEEVEVGRIEQGPTNTVYPNFNSEWKEWCETSPLAASLLGTQDEAVRDLSRTVRDLATSPSLPLSLRSPNADETAIELPYRLILSPHAHSGWIHAKDPVTHEEQTHEEQALGKTVPCHGEGGGRTELWHTRLGFREVKGGGNISVDEFSPYRSVRAVWTRDWPDHWSDSGSPMWWLTDDTTPFRTSLSTKDRQNLVHLTSNYYLNSNLYPPEHYDPSSRPVRVNRLMLSSLGAWVDASGSWDPQKMDRGTTYPYPFTIEAWKQRGTMGRDHYVQVVYKGYLFPLGHKASLVKVTERKFHGDKAGNPAYLRQRMYIVVKPVMDYTRETGAFTADGKSFDRQLPFSKITITTTVTPNLDLPDEENSTFGNRKIGYQTYNEDLFWPQVNGKDFHFNVIAEDRFNHPVEISVPLIFVGLKCAANEKALGTLIHGDEGVVNKYTGKRVTCEIHNQPLSILRDTDQQTTFDLYGIQFTANTPNEQNYLQLMKVYGEDAPQFYPAVDNFSLVIPAVREMTDNTAISQVRYDDIFLKEGLRGGSLFATITDGLNLSFSGKRDRCGAIIQPDFQITGLSQIMGPVGGSLEKFDSTIGGCNFYPDDFFGDAKIFGVISLKDIINPILGFTDSSPEIPKFISDGINRKIEFHWSPKLRNWNGIFLTNNNKATLNVDVCLTVEIGQDNILKKTIEVSTMMTNFTVRLLGDTYPFIEIPFNSLEFTSTAGKKPDVNVDLGDIQFLGPLSFVKELEKYIPLSGFSYSPVLDVTAEGISAGYTVAIPNVSVGLFSLTNLTLGGVATIPFTENPLSFRFNFCERQCPFELTYMAFGGRGFFNLTVDPKGVQVIEAALEFGADLSINFGVASGGVHVMAGIYFENDGGIVKLQGYLRMGGEVDVLGLISAAIELYMQLLYEAASGKCVGSATITVEVRVLFFCKDVEIHAERKFAGSGSDPTFREMMEPYHDEIWGTVDPWGVYCSAFAFVGAGGGD